MSPQREPRNGVAGFLIEVRGSGGPVHKMRVESVSYTWVRK
jgi:hypothetical protein